MKWAIVVEPAIDYEIMEADAPPRRRLFFGVNPSLCGLM